MSLDGIVTS